MSKSIALERLTQKSYEELEEAENSLELFTLAGRTVLCKIVDVYDGDTVKGAIFLYENVLKKFTIRMMGYDCPEMKTKNLTEKKFGQRSKEIMTKLVLGKIVKLECLEFDKYGRVLGNVYLHEMEHEQLSDFCVNTFMVNNHLGYAYFGDNKTKFDSLLKEGYYKEELIEVPSMQSYKIDFLPSNINVSDIKMNSEFSKVDVALDPIIINKHQIQEPSKSDVCIQVSKDTTNTSQQTQEPKKIYRILLGKLFSCCK